MIWVLKSADTALESTNSGTDSIDSLKIGMWAWAFRLVNNILGGILQCTVYIGDIWMAVLGYLTVFLF